jgi:arylsulfatase A-like enzyme
MPQRYLYFQYRQQKAIINGDWKYVRDVTAKEYLFNLAEDPSEQKNVAGALPQATTKLRNELDSFVARMQQDQQEG